jgi:signal transduction histidine kinase
MGGESHRRARRRRVSGRAGRDIERWIAWVRVGAVPFACFQVAVGTGYPPGYLLWVWLSTAVFAVGAAALFLAVRGALAPDRLRRLGLVALAFDTAVITSYVLAYNFERDTPIRQLLYLPLIEAAVRYGIAGSVALAALGAPVLAVFEWLRSRRAAPPDYRFDHVTFQVGVEAITALIVGWLVLRLRRERRVAEERASEAERLRDALGRRVDVFEAANRCARALGSSLELDEAFAAFIRELRGLLAFERMAIVLAEDGRARIMATAGRSAQEVLPPGTALEGSVLDELLATGETIYREDMADERFPEERAILQLGIHSRVCAPLQVGARTIGMLSVGRVEPSAFGAEDVELLTLLGRLVANAVQNIRAYDAERRTVEELRRLSALRADFVSLVSHELRSPMAAVIGASRTLEGRWRELTPEQRQAFLALIGDETSRLAALITDVLDTSRIEAGTFSFTFSDVDVDGLVREVAAAAAVGQDEVLVRARVNGSVPRVRGDRERLRQVLTNLVENAVKFSVAGGEVELTAFGDDGAVRVDVRDRGPGIAAADQKLIFEKFGRAHAGDARPGTGLGLFIARSIAEAHGGFLDVSSAPGAGATFTLRLPAGRGPA